jgi:hypothetical protein
MQPGLFIVKQEYFDHLSWLHGVNHTCRVMALIWAMGYELKDDTTRDLAFCAAFIHDMARENDGICRVHGSKAAENKLPLFKGFFISQGVLEFHLPAIAGAVHYHSLLEEPKPDNENYKVIALLKDADALDRIRLGPFDLDASYLRFPFSKNYILPARKLFLKTVRGTQCSPLASIEMLGNILRQDLFGNSDSSQNLL